MKTKKARPRSGKLEEPTATSVEELGDGGLKIVIQFSKDRAEWLRKDRADLRELGYDVSDEAEVVKEIFKLGSHCVAVKAKEKRRASELDPESEDESPVVH